MTVKYTHKTKDGQKARLVFSHAIGECPLVFLILLESGVESPQLYTNSLMYFLHGSSSPMDLTELSIWDDVAIDTPMWVYDGGLNVWVPVHFAKYSGGQLYAFRDGRTSHSGCDSVEINPNDCTLELALSTAV